MSLMSPGVEVIEKSVGQNIQTAASSWAAYVGLFTKGEAEKAIPIDSAATLTSIFGKSTLANSNDWHQCAQFLKYANTLYVTRVIDRDGIENTTAASTTVGANSIDDVEIEVDDASLYFVNQFVKIGTYSYQIDAIDAVLHVLTLKTALLENIDALSPVYIATPSYNAIAELGTYTIAPTDFELKSTLVTIANNEEFGYIQNSIQKASLETKLKFMARTPGAYYNGIEIAVANPADFTANATAFGTNVNDFFEYLPSVTNQEIGVLIKDQDGEISTYLVSLDPTSKDYRGKSTYIENVINSKDANVYVLDNTTIVGTPSAVTGNEISLSLGTNGKPGKNEIVLAYSNVYGNVEELKVDIFIANEMANVEVVDLAGSLGECIAIVGARYEDVVGFKAAKAVENLILYANGEFNISNKYGAFYGNYIEVYDSSLDKDVWVNLAGAVAGLRAKTNSEAGHWGANFGLDVYGQLTGVKRIAFNTVQTQRDLLYKLGINPVVSFTGQGNAIIWGNKTMWKSPDPFSRVHVRSLFNYVETLFRASAKYVIGKPNDEISRGIFRAATAPILDSIIAKRGITEYRIFYPKIIDDTVFEFECYIKPTGVVETVKLVFIAVANSITIDEVVGTV